MEQQEQLNIRVEDSKMETIKEMMHDSRDKMDGLTKGREQIDQKIVYFLGVVLFVFSTTVGFFIKPALFFITCKLYAPLVLLACSMLFLFGIICNLAVALLPRVTYTRGVGPAKYAENNGLVCDPRQTMIIISEHCQTMQTAVTTLIAKKAKSLKLSILLFGIAILAPMAFLVLFPSLAVQLLAALKA